MPALAAPTAYSFSAWIKPTSLDGGLIAGGGLNGALAGGVITLQAGTASAVTTATLSAGKWQHLAFTISDMLRVYLDGRLVAEAPGAALPTAGVNLGNGFKGEMDEVQIAGVARSADWIAVQWCWWWRYCSGCGSTTC